MAVTDDDLPPPHRRGRSLGGLWWMLIAAGAIIVGLVVARPEPEKTAPAEHGTTPVSRAPVELPAK